MVSVVVLFLFGFLATAQTAEEILKRVEGPGFFGTGRDSLYVALAVKIQEKGQPQVDYAFRVWAKEYPDGTVKFLLLYVAPEDVAGTLFLAVVPREGTAQMWLYLPELGILRELKGETERTGEFLAGSGITYEDLSRGFGYREGYQAVLLGEEALAAYPVWKLVLTPRDPGAEWGRILLWVHRSHFLVVQAEFYDRTGALSRVLRVPELVTDEAGTRPATLRVEDLRRGSWAEVRIFERSAAVIPDDYFVPANLPNLSL
jgi:hypothetical protein